MQGRPQTEAGAAFIEKTKLLEAAREALATAEKAEKEAREVEEAA